MSKILTIFLLLSSISIQAQEYQLAKPLVHIKGGEYFSNKAFITCEIRLKGASLHYTLDGEDPKLTSPRYRGPLKVKWSSNFKVKAFKEGFIPSETVEHRLFRASSPPESITLSPPPKAPYDGQGKKTLTDRKAGSFNFRDGQWIGYNEGPVMIVIDMSHAAPKRAVILSTLTSPGSWIMNPGSITTEYSNDGENWELKENIEIIPVNEGDPTKKQHYYVGMRDFYRYLKVTISPMKSLPDWHSGSGQPGWVFIDEIIIQR